MEYDIKKLNELLAIQGDSLTDSYMVGMYNGMECIIATLENREPNYKNDIEEEVK